MAISLLNIDKTKICSMAFTLIQLSLIKPIYAIESNRDVIYGKDNRYETVDYPDRLFREKAQSVAGMVRTRGLRPDYAKDPDNFTTFFKKTASRAYNICKNEPYAQENVLPFCTGFLVGEDILVTAGHCVSAQLPCEDYSWVFGFTKGTIRFPNKDIYRCKEVLAHKQISTKYKFKDYSVIRLDRKVEGRAPLEFRRKGKPLWGTKLLIIGHPFGLPQKIADGAKVKSGNFLHIFKPISTLMKKRDYFISNLDSFAGNSGSPVLNQKTGEVEGILVEGAHDFTFDEQSGCKRAIHKKNGANSAEEIVFRIDRIPYLQNL